VNPGDVWLLNLAQERSLGRKPWNFVWEINGQYQGNASGGAATPATSRATVISLSPGFQYSQKRANGRSVNWEAGLQVPVITRGDSPAIPRYTACAGGYVVF